MLTFDMLLVDSTFATRGHGGIANDNRSLVNYFKTQPNVHFLYDTSYKVSELNEHNLPRSLRLMNISGVLSGKAQSPGAWDGIFLQIHLNALSAPKGSIKRYIRIHDFFPLTNPEYFTRAGVYTFKTGYRNLNSNDILICNSNSTLSQACQFEKSKPLRKIILTCEVSLSKTQKIPCGVCVYCIGKMKSRNFLLAVGTIEPRKNYERLLEAWRVSNKKNFQYLLIAGRLGWKSSNLYRKIKQQVDVETFSPCDFGLQQLYKSSYAYISASLNEGFDIPTADAHTYNLPMLLSDISVHNEFFPELVGKFNPTSINEIARSISSNYIINKSNCELDFDKMRKIDLIKLKNELIS